MRIIIPLVGLVAAGALIKVIVPVNRSQACLSWTKESLARKLGEIGYKCKWVEPGEFDAHAQGLYVARQTDPRTWHEIAAKRPALEALWHGLVLVNYDKLNPDALGCFQRVSSHQLRVGMLLFFGDPDELDRIGAHLQP